MRQSHRVLCLSRTTADFFVVLMLFVQLGPLTVIGHLKRRRYRAITKKEGVCVNFSVVEKEWSPITSGVLTCVLMFFWHVALNSQFLIVLERHVGICHALVFEKWFSLKFIVWMLASAWFMSILEVGKYPGVYPEIKQSLVLGIPLVTTSQCTFHLHYSNMSFDLTLFDGSPCFEGQRLAVKISYFILFALSILVMIWLDACALRRLRSKNNVNCYDCLKFLLNNTLSNILNVHRRQLVKSLLGGQASFPLSFRGL